MFGLLSRLYDEGMSPTKRAVYTLVVTQRDIGYDLKAFHRVARTVAIVEAGEWIHKMENQMGKK